MYKVTEDNIDWIELESVGSTNTYLLERMGQWQRPTCVTANKQTAGRGRQGKPWYSPPGQQLLFSLYWHWEASFSPAPLSLVVAKVLAQSLNGCLLKLDPPVKPGDVGVKPVDVEVKPVDVGIKPENVGRKSHLSDRPKIMIKWPNDLQINGEKLAGILLESAATASGLGVVVGVGINYLPLSADQVEQPVTSLSQHSNQLPSQKALLRTLVRALVDACQQAQQQGFDALLADWSSVDALHGKQVRVTQADQTLEGVAAGIATNGALRLQQNDTIHLIRSGTVRLRSTR